MAIATSAPTSTSPAVYFDIRASPAHSPAPSHQPQPRPGSARTRQQAAASRAHTKGPSGSTHPPVVTPRTGDRVNAMAAHRPAWRENSSAVSWYISQVDRAASAMKGSRTTQAASLPASRAMPAESHQTAGGWSK